MLLQSVEKCSVFFTFVQRCYSMLSMVNTSIVVQLFVLSAKYPFNHCSACSIFLISRFLNVLVSVTFYYAFLYVMLFRLYDYIKRQ